ncbi:zinc finger, PHD-type, homeodomain-like, zinc finger, RING/FYVE/PHD-type containing protein [Tanacetum coccineum]
MSTASASSASTDMAWNWVVQSLAKFKQVDSSTSLRLVEKAPAISDDTGKDARETVSLRVLEDMFIDENEATDDTDSSQTDRISFDPSENCEDVLHTIAGEVPQALTHLEKRSWNVVPFILHKRACLPKSSLQKLKEALVEGSRPFPASLKEMSKLGGEGESQIKFHDVDVSSNIQETIVKVDSITLNPANKYNNLEETRLQKSDYVEVSIEPHVKDLEKNMLMDQVEDTVIDTDFRQQEPRGDDDVDVHQGRYRKEHGNRVQIDLLPNDGNEVAPPVKGLEENTLMNHVEHTIDDTDFRQQEPLGVDDNAQEDRYREGQDERVHMDIPPNDGNQVETGSDSEGSDDERTDIAAKKEAFFSSQGTLNQDFMATVDCSELCICMKCNKGGQLLVCSSDACPFRVHERCLGSAATFDEHRNFFCPFCAYSHAISKYLEVKKKASFARKYLQAFLNPGVKHGPKTSSKKGACLDKNDSRKKGAAGENFEVSVNNHTPSCNDEVGAAGPSTNSLRQPRRQPVKPKLQDNVKGTFVSSVPSPSNRPQKRKPQYTCPSLTLARRKILPWTELEENTLKEAMQKFSNAENLPIPWKEILDFGNNVFGGRRTTIDLKDKWRNMCKDRPSKKQKL